MPSRARLSTNTVHSIIALIIGAVNFYTKRWLSEEHNTLVLSMRPEADAVSKVIERQAGGTGVALSEGGKADAGAAPALPGQLRRPPARIPQANFR